MTPILYIKDGNLGFGEKHVLIDVEIYISPGDRICLVGRNGSGKSSLMKLIDGEYEIDSGEIYKDPAIKIGFLRQDMKEVGEETIYDYVLKDFKDKEANRFQADIILENLQIDGNMKLKNCSGGQRRRAFLAHSLVLQPDILLLDEPTNHLDIAAIEWLETYVNGYRGAIICISHDRTFLENTTNKVWWIDRGEIRKSNRGFRHYEEWKEEIIAEEESKLRNMNRRLEAERGWLNTGVTARRKRNQKRLANLYRLREQMREHADKLRSAKAKLQFELLEEAKKTKFILQAEGLKFDYEGKQIIDNFSIKVKKGEKIGIIGPNGSGKTTLIRLLTKDLEAQEGRVKHGTKLEITYFDQHRTELNPQHTLQKTLCPTGGDQVFLKDRTMHVAGYLKNFMFDPRQIHDKVATLSGGQANRLLLAKALISPGNLLILDEPTNDLDMESLEILHEILAEYDGTLIVVSHDRDFLEKLVTRTLVFAEDDVIDLYGGYEDYQKFYKKQDEPKKGGAGKAKQSKERAADKKLKKLSYKYERLLEVLPEEIEKLEARIKDIESALMDPNMYTDQPEKFQKLSDELVQSKAAIEEKLEQWAEVEKMKLDVSSQDDTK